VTFSGWLQRVQVERVSNHQRRIAVDFDISREGGAGGSSAQSAAPSAGSGQALSGSERDTVLQDGDVVKVFGVTTWDEKIVSLEGHVYRPASTNGSRECG